MQTHLNPSISAAGAVTCAMSMPIDNERQIQIEKKTQQNARCTLDTKYRLQIVMQIANVEVTCDD